MSGFVSRKMLSRVDTLGRDGIPAASWTPHQLQMPRYSARGPSPKQINLICNTLVHFRTPHCTEYLAFTLNKGKSTTCDFIGLL